jgi:16S rRNA (cytosine967-C5)-methyltransferase
VLPEEGSVARIATLLKHAAELYRITAKSSMSTRAIASEFLHGKKTLRPPERLWIAGRVFAALRMKSLAEHCAEAALEIVPGGMHGSVIGDLNNLLVVSSTVLVASRVDTGAATATGETGGHHEDSLRSFSVAAEEALRATLPAEVDCRLAAELLKKLLAAFDDLDRRSAAIDPAASLTVDEIKTLSLRYSAPSFFLNSWLDDPALSASVSDAILLAESLLHPASVGLRVATSFVSRASVIASLLDSGIRAHPMRYSPAGIVLEKRADLANHPVYASASVEVQDEGSQLVSYALNPLPQWHVLDACAGAGGKTLHLADLKRDMGAVLAVDVEVNRLRELKARMRRRGYMSISTRRSVTLHDARKGRKLPDDTFDAVLVDAPCSSTGTVRRAPALKWRATESMLRRLSAGQLNLLERNAGAVKPGGVLVYATCSLMRRENSDVVRLFLEKHPEFSPDPLYPQFHSFGIDLPYLNRDDWYISLTPSRHGTDGFFIARMRKT